MSPPLSEGRFERNTRTVAGLTLVSRVTGLARDAVLSRAFGAGGLMDAFFFAFMIPNLFRRLFGEGALAAAFLPVYSRLRDDDPDAARRVASVVLGRLMILLGAAVAVAEGLLIAIDALHAAPDPLPLRLMMIMLPYMPLVCAVALLGAILQVHGRFGPTAAAPIILNLAMIAAATLGGLAFATDRAAVILVAIAVVLAGGLQVGWSLAALRDDRVWIRDRSGVDAHVRAIMRTAGPMILGLGVLQLNTFFDGVIASYPTTVGATIFGVDYPLDEGAMASLSFAQRLYQFPLGVFGIAVATAIFPELAKAAQDDDAFGDIVRRGLRLVVFIGLPASVGLILVARPLTAVLLQGGEFTADDAARVAFVLTGYAPAVWAYSMIHVLTRAFYARDDSMTPVKVAIAMVALNLALNCTLIWTPLREAGLAWSTAICAMIQVIALARLTSAKHGVGPDRTVWMSWSKTALAVALMTGALFACGLILDDAPTWTAAAVRLAVLTAIGAGVMFAAARGLGMPEWRWALGRR